MAILAYMLLVVLFSKYIVYPIAIALFTLIAIHEIQKVTGVNKKLLIAIPACIMAVAFPTFAYFVTVDNANEFLLILFAYAAGYRRALPYNI